MSSFRSRRLESVLGASVDAVTSENVRGLVASQVPESHDLDFKQGLYERTDGARRDLAGDVAALANTAGGVLLVGVEEDENGRAAGTPGVELSDGEMTRMRQVVAELVVPMPDFEVLTVTDAQLSQADEARGYFVVAVQRSNAGPHAVRVNQAFRYPQRNGTTTRYLSEPEVASAYRNRFRGEKQQVDRIREIELEATARLDTSRGPWVVVALVPDVPGDFVLDHEAYLRFRDEILVDQVSIIGRGITFARASVGRRRLLADGSHGNSPTAGWVSVELHRDGSGVYGVRVADLNEREWHTNEDDENRVQLIDDESIADALLSGMVRLAVHARDRAAAGGTALVSAQLVPAAGDSPTGIGHTRQFGFGHSRGQSALKAPPAAEASASIDDLAQPGKPLVATAALLMDELAQWFGIPEMGQLTRDGRVRRRYWSHRTVARMEAWVEGSDVEIVEDTLGAAG